MSTATALQPERLHSIAADPATASVPASNLTQHTGQITLDERVGLFRHRPVTLWLTGLSATGKSTLAYALEKRLLEAGHACVVLDGDNLRHGLNRELGFTPADRTANISRVAEVARLFNDAGLLVVTAFISPYRADREQARAVIGEARFVEAFVDTPLDECERRDPKGLYAKARAGKLPEFTGVSAPYEPPATPELRLDTVRFSAEELVETAMGALSSRATFARARAGLSILPGGAKAGSGRAATGKRHRSTRT